MRRRDFIKAIGVAGVPWLIAGRAQPAIHVPTIGFLGPSTAPTALPRVAAFSKRLAQLGWIDGRTVAISYRWANGHSERFSELAAELVRREVDVIATWGTATAVAAKQQTSVIPIVFTVVGDPVGSGLVASLARPGGNVTGLSTQHDDTAGKRLQSCARLFPIYAGSRSWRIRVILVQYWRYSSLTRRPARLISKLQNSSSNARKISHPLSSRPAGPHRRSMSLQMRSSTRTGYASTL